MQFVLLPFALCFLLYIRQENRYRFRAATALKVTLTLTLALCLTVALLALALALKGVGRWDTSENDPWLTLYIVLVAMTAAKSLSAALAVPGAPGSLLLGLGGLLFFLSDMVLGMWNYQKNHILLADLNWLLYFSGQFLLCAGYIAAT